MFRTAEETSCAQVKLLVYLLNPLDSCQTQEPVARSKMNTRVFLFGYHLVLDIVMNTEPHNHHALFSPLLIWREKLKTSAGEQWRARMGEMGEILAYRSPEVTEEVSFEGQMSL